MGGARKSGLNVVEEDVVEEEEDHESGHHPQLQEPQPGQQHGDEGEAKQV